VHECRWFAGTRADSAPVVRTITKASGNAEVGAPLELDQSTLLYSWSINLEAKFCGQLREKVRLFKRNTISVSNRNSY
jgi:hypothetical protein